MSRFTGQMVKLFGGLTRAHLKNWRQNMIENWMVSPIKYRERIRKLKKVSTKKVQPVVKPKDSRWNLSIYV